ncbi:hypothetical protein Nepgr_007199 [Nepenthes gracilis]|uniref:Gnk2-homologous domain-containing protein n=1 Tax=Nepenthes gracilis TaxID=150966 RepID=A0AAD3S6N4_NEPGR|nr:hypothetical protein Nepgr_007199 [Nepenthes gracilis]
MPSSIIFNPFIFPSLFFLISSTVPTTISSPDYVYSICSNTTTFATNSSYQTNLNSVLTSLTSNSTTQRGFYNTSAGDGGASTVYGILLCRGDDTEDVCRTCVATAVKAVPVYCPNRKQAVIWYDVCMIRYSNESFFGELDATDIIYLWDANNITNNVTGFTYVLGDTMNNIAKTAAKGQSGKKFATAEANINSLQKLYTLAQCTPDLSYSDCYSCLTDSVSLLSGCCSGKQGGRVLFGSCNIRYEIYSFYENAAAAPPAPASPTPLAAAPLRRPPSIAPTMVQVLVSPYVKDEPHNGGEDNYPTYGFQNNNAYYTLWASQNVSDGFLRTTTDQSKASILAPDPTLHGLNNSDPAALVIDRTRDAVSHNKGKPPLLSTDDLVQPDAKLDHKKIEAPVLFRGMAPLLHPVNNLEMKILPVSSSANSANLNTKSLKAPVAIGSAISLVPNMQARSTVRTFILGSLSMICDRFSIRLEKFGNEQFLVEHERPGHTSLFLSRQITLWPLEMHSVPPLQNTLGLWCIHVTINSSSLEDHIGCKASPGTEDDGVAVSWSQPFGPTNRLSTDEKLQESIEMDEVQGASKHYTQPSECQTGWATTGQIPLNFPQAHLSSFQASRSSKLHHALSIAQIQDGYESYPWERKMQETLSIPISSCFLSILFLPKASDRLASSYNDVEDTLARANAWLNASQEIGVPIVITNIPTESLLTKISTIDLVDEAAAKLKMEITSKPPELDEIDREILKLEMEKLSLKNDTDKASKERLPKLESDRDLEDQM